MVKVKQVQKNYNQFHLDCSMEVTPGRITGIIGRNGAGKSTLFKGMLGLISMDGGTIELFGNDVNQMDTKEKQKLGVVMADSGFSGYLCIKDVSSILDNLYQEFDKEKFLSLCKRFSLPLNKKIKDFSTGMKAMFKVIVAITHSASLLILDEPTAGLDKVARDELLDLLRSYMADDDQNSIIISSHISTDLENLCDDFYLIDQGEILLHEDTDMLLASYAVLKVTQAQYDKLDKRFLLKGRKDTFGYRCLTREKQFYVENYPDIVIENGSIDELMGLLVGGVR